MDDFSVYGDTYESCLEHLEHVLEKCEEGHLVINWEKCHFMVTQGIVLGQIMSSKGIKVDKAKVELIQHLPIGILLKILLTSSYRKRCKILFRACWILSAFY